MKTTCAFNSDRNLVQTYRQSFSNSWLLVFLLLILSAPWASFADRAEETYRKGVAAFGVRDYDFAVSLFGEVIQLVPTNPVAYYGRANAYYKKGDFNKALADYSEAIRLAPKFVEAYANRGAVYVCKGEFDKAIADYSEVVRANPKLSKPYVYRADAYFRKGKLGKAIADCDEAIRLDTNNPEAYYAYYKRGDAYAEKGNKEKAIADFSEAVRLNPKHADAYADRGLIYARKGDYAKGLADCSEAVRLDTNSAHALNNYAWLLTVCPDAKLRDGAKALELAKKACELNGWKHSHFLGTFAAANAEVGNFEEAVKWQRKCLESDLPKSEQHEARQHLRLYEQKKPYHDKKR